MYFNAVQGHDRIFGQIQFGHSEVSPQVCDRRGVRDHKNVGRAMN